MLDTAMIKSLLDHDFFEGTRGKLRASLFGEEVRELYEILEAAHDKYRRHLTLDDLLLLWRTNNPVATRAELADIRDIIDDVSRQDPYQLDIASDVITTLWQRDLAKQITAHSLRMMEGDLSAFEKIKALIERNGDNLIEDEFGEPCTDDIEVLLQQRLDNPRYEFNLETLRRRVPGIGRKEFGIVFANPETGKTAFLVSIAVGPGGFVDQGSKVLFIGNEEAVERTMWRAYNAALGLTEDEIAKDAMRAKMMFQAKTKGRVILKDSQEWDLAKIERYIAKTQADVVIIDQADKVQIDGQYNAGHERLRELYRRLREAAKRHNCVIIGVCQASAEAKGKTKLPYTMMEGSKIGKAAEADLIIGIGKHEDSSESNEPDNTRFLTVSKNKLSGWHGTIPCTIIPEVSRYDV